MLVFRAVSQKARPDWDLSAPGLRENWESGDKGKHFPYAQREPQPAQPAKPNASA